MRFQWRLLQLLRCVPSRCHSRFQVHSLRPFSSSSHLLNSLATRLPQPPPSFYINNLGFQRFSYCQLLDGDHNKVSSYVSVLNDIFSKNVASNDDFKLELESKGLVVSHELVSQGLRELDNSPEVARRFFDWVSECEPERLSSQSYNLILGVLGVNGLVKEFWNMVLFMKKKGYGVSKSTYNRVLETFEKGGLEGDIEKLKVLFVPGSVDDSIEKVCSTVCKVIRGDLWGEDVEKQLFDLNVKFSSDLVAKVLDSLGAEQNKALIFFRWVEESGLLKHDELTYNAMARVLGNGDFSEKFWRVVDDMRGAGYELDKVTYVNVLNQFVRRRMMKDAVNLFEFMMLFNTCKPSAQDCTFLLKKIVVSKELDLDLLQKVVRVFKAGGNVLENSTLDAVLKSLTSVGRLRECNNVFKLLEEGGLLPSDATQSKVAFQLSCCGNTNEASEFMNDMEASGYTPGNRTWVALVEGYYVAGYLDEASCCLHRMIDKVGVSNARYPTELLVNAYCGKKRAIDAFKLLSVLIRDKEFKPRHSTYKALLKNLLVQGGLKEGLDVLGLMKAQGYPPFLDPFIEHISRHRNADDALMFLKSVTVKSFPSTAVVHRVFEAYFKAERYNEAQDLLFKCPAYIRNDADILNLFCSQRYFGEDAGTNVAA